MFWQVVLFILITFGIGFVRAMGKQESDSAVTILITSIIGYFASLFYVPWAIIWSLRFLIDFNGLGYWQVMGLMVLIKIVFSKIESDN